MGAVGGAAAAELRARAAARNATRAIVATALVVASIASAMAASAEPPAGASACSGCHPADRTMATAAASLAGRNPDEIVAAMRAFRSGARVSTVMDRIARGFSDAEVEAIAAWFGMQQ
jgi:cytochrome subunit of sulfide dehydrogenase